MNNSLFGVDGKNILVTGGTRGIGRSISLQLARSGAKILANYARNQETADSLASIASKENLSITLVRADLTKQDKVEELLSTTESWLSECKLDGIIHCAATGVHKELDELSLRQFDWTFNLNIRAFFDLITRLKDKLGSGSSIIGISSLGSSRASSTYSLVGASKGALDSFLRHLAVEWGRQGIRSNIICPGTVETDAWSAMPDSSERLGIAKEKIPLGKLTTPEEVSYCAQFLCSDASKGISGSTIVVDSGESISV